MEINITEKRRELTDIWQRTLTLCDVLVRDVEEGKSKMRASTLRELNQFLKASVDILDRLEDINRKTHAEEMYTDDRDLSPDDLGEGWDVPFPIKDQAEPLKTDF